jgi:K+-sensing histidine kinase KdpD
MNFGKYQTYVLEPVRTWAAPVLRLLLPIILSAFAVTFTSILPGTSSSPYLVLLLAAVISSAWLAGLRAGLIATILAVGCAAYFLMEPLYSLAVSEVTHLLHLLVAALAMLFFSWIVGTHGRGPSKATMWRG